MFSTSLSAQASEKQAAVQQLSVPTDIQIKALYDSNPALIYEMVRKLYVLEHSAPVIQFPMFTAILEKNSDLVVNYSAPLKLDIGISPYSLSYTIDLKPDVLHGFRQPTVSPLKTGIEIVGIVALAGISFYAGQHFH